MNAKILLAILAIAALLAGCSSGDSAETQAEKTANEKAGPPPAGVTPTEVGPPPRGRAGAPPTAP